MPGLLTHTPTFGDNLEAGVEQRMSFIVEDDDDDDCVTTV